MRKKRLLFFGELPPDAVHGIAIQNRINLDMLTNDFLIDTVQDKRTFQEHEKITFLKFSRLLRSIFDVLKLTIRYRYAFLYLPFSLTTLGGLKTLMVVLAFKSTNNGKLVLHIHRGDFFLRFYRNWINRLITKIVFSFCTKILVLSEKQKLEFVNNFRKEFQVLPNTIEKEIAPRFTGRGTFKFLYISNYLEDKGILDLLEVFTDILEWKADVSLRTFGQFANDKMKQAVEKYASDRIYVDGIISTTEKFRILSDADCLILPSWNEGQPVIILEAMSVGTPVISTLTGLIPEMLCPGYPYLSIPANRKSLEAKILEFLTDNKVEEYSVQLYENYIYNFSRKSHKACLYSIFDLKHLC